jgi:hypothetical protein
MTHMLEEQRTMTLEAQPAADALAGYTVIPLALEGQRPEDPRRVFGAIVLLDASVHAASVSGRFVRRSLEMLYEAADISTFRAS